MNSETQYNLVKKSNFLSKLNSSFSQKSILKKISNKNKKKQKHRSLSNVHNMKEKTKIIWSEGGKEIYLTGSFCHWNKLYLMKKDKKNDFFYCIIDLPKGFHQFKFKVDGKWKNSSIYPIFNDQGNINNYLDKTYLINDNSSMSTVESSVISTNNKNKTNNNNNNSNVNTDLKLSFSFSRKNYCNYYPNKKEMKEYTDKKPIHFQTECYHGVNQVQNLIGNRKYLNLEEDNIYSSNDSYKAIERKDHVLLNHFCNRQKINDNVIISSVSIKYRNKNLTVVYYK